MRGYFINFRLSKLSFSDILPKFQTFNLLFNMKKTILSYTLAALVLLAQISSSNAAPTQESNDNACPPVTYAQILKAPDDERLNYCYIDQKIKQQDYKAALPALERLLALSPERDDIRLVYASTLKQLGMDDLAAAEINQVKENKAKMEKANNHMRLSEKQKDRLRRAFTFALGMQYDSNRNAGPDSNSYLVNGNVFSNISAQSKEDDDFSYIGLGRYDIAYDVGEKLNHTIFANVTYYKNDQISRDELDLDSFTGDAGMRFQLNDGLWFSTIANYANMDLSKEKFYQSSGATLRLDHRHYPEGSKLPLDLWASTKWSYESYGNITENPTLRDRRGHKFQTELGSIMRASNKHAFTAKIGYTRANAKVNYQEYDFWNAELGHFWDLDKGKYLRTTIAYGQREYDASDPLVTGNSSRKREDKPLRFNMTYNVPVANILDASGLSFSDKKAADIPFFDKLDISFSGEYLHQDANITNYEYDNVRGQILITKRYEF